MIALLLAVVVMAGNLDPTLLWDAICFVESRHNPSAYHPGEDAVGVAQIRMTVVDDLNRISGWEAWESEDRWDVGKSEEMFWAYTGHWINRFGLPDTPEIRARIWNGGPRGWEKTATLKYWRKVKLYIENKK